MARDPKQKSRRGGDAEKPAADDSVIPIRDAKSAEPGDTPDPDPSPPVEDTELLDMLEHLSKTIDTAHSVLDEQHRMVMEATQPPMPHLPGVEPVQPAAEPKPSRSGPVIAMVTAAVSAVLAIGALGAWWLFLNQPDAAAPVRAGKDEARIANLDASGAGPTNPEPPLPQKNPGRQIAAEVATVPAQQRREPTRSPGTVDLTKAIDRTPGQPADVQRRAPQRTARVANAPVSQPQAAPAPQLRVTPVVPQRVAPLAAPAPQQPTAPQPPPAPVQSAEPQPPVTPPSPTVQAPRATSQEPAGVQNRPVASPAPAAPQAAGGQTQPTQTARLTPEKPPTSNKLAPKKKTPTPLTSAQEKSILNRGEEMKKLGDIAGARLVLEYAALRGSGQAMFALAQTFDPQFLSARGVIGVAPDVSTALKWYRQAANLGIAAAGPRVRALETQAGRRP